MSHHQPTLNNANDMASTDEPQAAEAPTTEGGPVQALVPQPALESGDAQNLNQSIADDSSKSTEPTSTNGADAASKNAESQSAADGAVGTPGTPGTPLSKNAQKKLKRQQKWEDQRDDRKRRRKEKRVMKAEKKKAAKAADGSADAPVVAVAPKEHTLVPVSLIFDCAFESLMRETEQISLASQITRSYAANRTAARNVRIYVSSWGGNLKTRYETLLSNQHKRWNNVHFLEDDFVAAGNQADADMRREGGGTIVDFLEAKEGEGPALKKDEVVQKEKKKNGEADAAEQKETEVEVEEEEEAPVDGPSVVYLTSDSPNTLTRLEPYTSYVIGGIVDKNREKGLCYRRAREHRIRTAKLPIGDYMVMASRKVLTTNHVVEIMLSWLETGDWATAFANVIPKRKGGHLKGENGEKGEEAGTNDGQEGDGEAEEDEEKGDEEEAGAEAVAGSSAMDLQEDGGAAKPQVESETAAAESASAS